MASEQTTTSWRDQANRAFDKLAASALARRPGAWFSCILIGSGTGIACAAMAAWAVGHSPGLTAGTSLGAGVSCLGVAMTRKIWTGEERYAYYPYLLVATGASVLILFLSGRPVLAYLDLIAVAVAIAQASGRVGCLLVGCCHGKPHTWGICYESDHVSAGFPSCYAGVRLFPVQAAESAIGVLLAFVVLALVLLGSSPGTATSTYVLGYAAARFFLEFFRGDFGRATYRGLSEAQCTSTLLIVAVILAASVDILPILAGISGVTAFVIVATALILINTRGRAERRRLVEADHLLDLAEVVEKLTPTTGTPEHIGVAQTGLGICVSGGPFRSDAWAGFHFALSRSDGIMDDEIAASMSARILRLRRPASEHVLLRGRQAGIYHLLVRD